MASSKIHEEMWNFRKRVEEAEEELGIEEDEEGEVDELVQVGRFRAPTRMPKRVGRRLAPKMRERT